ncbi:MAG: hypothetical protein IKV55_07310, partial [Oscillospiraceae bacterium]|nr:hypothetical protein [Oscillospiraceae bacterium]
VCKNCGAPAEKEQRVCPYCGAENEQLAAQDQQAELQGIFARIAQLLHLPQRAAQKAARFFARAGKWIAAVFLLGLAAALVFSALGPRMELKKQQRALQQLEELYAAADYEAVLQRMQELDHGYRAVYEKYDITAELCDGVLYLREFAQETAEFVAGFPDGADLLDYDFNRLFSLLVLCEERQALRFPCGEQAAVQWAKEEALRFAEETYLLTEADIALGMAEALKEQPDYSALRQTCLQYLLEDKR